MQGLLAGGGAAILLGNEPGVVGDRGNRRPADRRHQLRLAMQERGFLRAAVPKPPRAPILAGRRRTREVARSAGRPSLTPRSFAFVKPVRTRSEWSGGLLFPRRLVAMPGGRLSYGPATSAPGLSSAVSGVLARSLASDVWKLCAFQGPPSAL